MAHNYTGLVKAVNTTNRQREVARLSEGKPTAQMAEVMAPMPARPTMLSIGELRNPGGLSGDDPNVRYINGRVVRVKPPCRSNRGLG